MKISYGSNLKTNFLYRSFNLFVCYLHTPQDTPYFGPDIFNDLEKDITKFSAEGLIMLAGDLNARTGCVLDFVNTDD